MRATTRAQHVIGAMAVAMSLSLLLAAPANADVTGRPPEGVESSDQTITVTVSGSASKGGSSGSGGGATVRVHPPCFRVPVETGKQYYDYVESGRELFLAEKQGLPYEPRAGYQEHKDDVLGHWYARGCDDGGPDPTDLTDWSSYLEQLWAGPYYVYYEATQPPQLPPVPWEVLRDTAVESLTPPDPELNWNPKRTLNQGTLVNMDTWFWLDNAPESLEVRATALGRWASVTATYTGMDITAPYEEPLSCTGPNTPYVPGAHTTPCALRFSRASVGLGAETTPVSVTTRWTGTWTANGAPRGPITLQADPNATANIRVDEVQTLVTGTG